ncbi:hypothetical protein [Micromonospora marina]|uniref:MYXO-CTERM domain-containing protein n=1 Tax=Micromonospora marina TaxID=307120 RepID=A0A1C4YBU9_9ACTN|nr:hypothetical protein [Micromonospora marina]SCF18178.1 hypothetical protein GA0070215_110136 [Micromonospora marina]
METLVMAKKMLGKVVAGAALGGAGLLVFTPGMAYAGGHDEGKVVARPHVVKAGDTVELLAICSEPQKHATVWSKVTGKVDLHPARDGEHGDRTDRGGDHGKGPDGKGPDGKGPDGKGPDGKGPDGKGPDGKGPDGKGPDGKDDHGKGPDGRGEPGGDGHGPDGNGPGGNGPGGNGPGGDGMPQPPANQPQPPAGQPGGQPQPGGAGGGTAVDPGDWQGHDEYGQDAEPGWEKEQRGAPDWTRDAHGSDGKGRYGKDAKGEHGKDAKGEHGKDAKGEHGSWQGGKDEHGSWQDDKGDWQGRDEHGLWPDDKGDHGKDDWQASGGAWQDDKGGYGRDAEHDYGDDGWEHGKDFVYYGEATVSHDARPGRYELRGTCGEGELVVLPRGGVDGGDGGMTSTGVDRNLATGGAGMIGAAALGGLVLLRRRRAGGLV